MRATGGGGKGHESNSQAGMSLNYGGEERLLRSFCDEP